MTSHSNKVAIVTGSSRGIGRAVAWRLARDGFAVVVNYAGGAEEADALVGKIQAAGGRAISVQADVADSTAVSRLFDAAEAEFGGVDVLVNNAGVMMLKPIAESDDAFFDRQVAINLKGTFNGLREAALRLRDSGRIVNFSTSVVGTRLETYGVYAATKAAVETLTAILAKELRGRNITVNAVAPRPASAFRQQHFMSSDAAPAARPGAFQGGAEAPECPDALKAASVRRSSGSRPACDRGGPGARDGFAARLRHRRARSPRPGRGDRRWR
jgi:3-oxoacyl-[acyl-carrier protein] reductase